MVRHRISALVLLVTGLLWLPSAALAQPQPTRLDVTVKDVDGALESDWFGIYFQGKKIGYYNSSRTKVKADDKTYYREKLYMSMKIQSFGQKSEMKIEQTTDFEVNPPFRLVRSDYVHIDDKLTERIELAVKDKGYEATITVSGVARTKQIDDLDFSLADSLSAELWVKRKPKKGDQITTRDLEIEDLKVELSTATLLDYKETLVNGVKVLFSEVKSVSLKTGVTSEQKNDDKGRLISGTIAGVFEMRRESEENAKNTEFSSDLFLLGLAKIDKGIGDTSKVTGLVMEIEAKDGTLLPDGPRQTLISKGNDIYQLRTGKKYGKYVKATEADIKDALQDTVAYPIHDVEVKKLAKRAIGDAKTDKEKAKNICKFVKDFISPSLQATLPKMHDLIERKEGDCKSYALLFTCLSRAAGLPSREVSGFVYMGDDVKSFGGHAWNEVLLDGYWVPVDATLNQVDCDPTHICLGTDKESSNNLLQTFGKLNFKLIEVERDKN